MNKENFKIDKSLAMFLVIIILGILIAIINRNHPSTNIEPEPASSRAELGVW